MEPLKIIETTTGNYSLLLNAGDTIVDEAVEELGHEPNGYFWEGIATLLMKEDEELTERLELDPEGSMFCAFGTDREALEQLGKLMANVANNRDRLEAIMKRAQESGFEFDD